NARQPLQASSALRMARIRRSRRTDELRTKSHRTLSPDRHLYRPHSQRSQASRAAGDPINEIRTGDQPQDREGAWGDYPQYGSHCGRRDDRVKRREFISLLGGAAAAWPLAARAQQGERVRRVGVLMNVAADDPEGQARIVAFVQGLQQSGWSDGHNVRIDIRWGGGDPERIRKYAAELVALAPDAILAMTTGVVVPLQQAAHTVPIVFVQDIDPVGAGMVASLARPGGNTTGFTVFEYCMSGKWVELLKEIAPGVKRVAVVRDLVIGIAQLAAIQAVAPSLGVELSVIGVRDADEFESAV